MRAGIEGADAAGVHVLTTKTRHLNRLGQLSEFEQESNTESQQVHILCASRDAFLIKSLCCKTCVFSSRDGAVQHSTADEGIDRCPEQEAAQEYMYVQQHRHGIPTGLASSVSSSRTEGVQCACGRSNWCFATISFRCKNRWKDALVREQARLRALGHMQEVHVCYNKATSQPAWHWCTCGGSHRCGSRCAYEPLATCTRCTCVTTKRHLNRLGTGAQVKGRTAAGAGASTSPRARGGLHSRYRWKVPAW